MDGKKYLIHVSWIHNVTIVFYANTRRCSVACLWQNCVGGVTQLNTSQQRPAAGWQRSRGLGYLFMYMSDSIQTNQLKCCNFKLIFNGTFFAVFGTKLLFPSHVKSKIAFSADNYNSSSTSLPPAVSCTALQAARRSELILQSPRSVRELSPAGCSMVRS